MVCILDDCGKMRKDDNGAWESLTADGKGKVKGGICQKRKERKDANTF
jgi:hypothetical protein